MNVRPSGLRGPFGAALLAGLLALRAAIAAGADGESAVALPPFIVEELAKGPPWRYAEAPGYEILSRCSDATTRRVVEAHVRLHELLSELVPARLRLELAEPRSLILYDEELQPAASQQHPQGMRTGQGGLAFKQLSSNRQIGILNSGDGLMSRQCANHKAFMTEGREHLR